jgi:hypothetical protein
MNTAEETAGITAGLMKDATVEVTKKAMEVMKELLAAMILKTTEHLNRDTAKAGATNKIQDLLKKGNNLNAPVQIDKQDIPALYKLAKEHHIPLAVVKGREGSRLFFRESDLARVSEMMKELLQNKVEQQPMKQIVMSKEDAALFKTRAKLVDAPVTFFKHNDQVKISFKESDIEKVQLALDDLKAHKEKIPSRQIKFDQLKDRVNSALSGKPLVRLYDKNLQKSVRIELPVTKKAFIQSVRSAFGYSNKEAMDLASRVKNGKEADALFTGMKEQFEWKPDIKAISSQIAKLESDIRLANESDPLKGYSFSSLELADGRKTSVLTIMDKNNNESFSTFAVPAAELKKDLMHKFGMSNETAEMMVSKASKLGFTTEDAPSRDLTAIVKKQMRSKLLDNCEISKSSNSNTATFTYGGNTLKTDLGNKDATIQGLQSSFGITEKEASSLYTKAQKQGVKEVTKSVEKKYQEQKTTKMQQQPTHIKTQGAR